MQRSFVNAAVAMMLPLMFSSSAISATGPDGQGISVSVTLGTDPTPGACGNDTNLQVTAGDQINYCYVVTNDTSETLNWHSLTDDVVGAIFTDIPGTVAPGEKFQYNRLVTATATESPVSTWTAYDVHPDFGHVAAADGELLRDGFDGDTASYLFTDITSTGTNLQLFDDDYIVTPIGFPFTFYGQTADMITVSNNGGMLFDQATRGRADYLSPSNRTLPDRMMGPAILPYWDDLQQDYIDGIGNVFTQTVGEAPNRQFIVEWFNLPENFGGAGETVTIEAILYEGSNAIEFVYPDTNCGSSVCNSGVGATVGLNSDGTHGILISFNEPTAVSGTATLFRPTSPTTYVASQQVTLDVGAPIIGVDPTSFSETVDAGASTTDTLTISNTGNRDLSWNIGSVGARSHFPPVPRFALPMGDPANAPIGPAPLAPSAKAHVPHPRAPIGVPAFAADPINAAIVTFDAAAPATLTGTLPVDGLQFLSGDFIGEDFSTLYAIDFRSFNLYKVDTATGTPTLVYLTVPPPGVSADGWNGMAWDESTHTMFAVTSGGRTPVSSLVKLNTETTETTLVGTITGVGDPTNGTAIIDIAIDPNGLMYGVDIVTDTLVAIDKTTGEASTIGSIGFDAAYAEGLDFDDTTGTLYFSAFDFSQNLAVMYTLDTETGMGTPISPIGPTPDSVQYSALAIARLAGICAYPEDIPWLGYSDTRGSTAPGDSTPVTVTFDATGLTADTYTANVCVNNNDLTNKRLAVPVTLTVQ